MKVAIFQANWLLQIHTVNLVQGFADRDWLVDVFFYNVDQHLVDGQQLSDINGVTLHEYSDNILATAVNRSTRYLDWSWKDALKPRYNQRPSLASVLLATLKITIQCIAYFPAYLNWTVLGNINTLISSKTLKHISEDCKDKHYDLVIGVEALGLVLAETHTRSQRCLLAYYSLEIESHTLQPYLHGQLQHRLEKKAHQKCQFTLIQDCMRWKVLQKSNNIYNSNPIFIPVSIKGSATPHRTDYLHKKLGINDRKKILLSLGVVSWSRYVRELIYVSPDLPEDWVVVFHGPAWEAEKEEIQELMTNLPKTNVFWSSELGDPNILHHIVASARAGLALYPNYDANNLLTAKSSEKIAFYAKACLPLISFDYPSYSLMYNEYEWGVRIKSIEQLPSALKRIDDNYDHYSCNAQEAFRQIYHFDKHFDKFNQSAKQALDLL